MTGSVVKCSRCRKEKPAADFEYRRVKSSGTSNKCVECRAIFRAAVERYNQRHAEKLRDKRKEKWAAIQRGKGKKVGIKLSAEELKRRERACAQRPVYKERAREFARKKRAADVVAARAREREWYRRNPEKARARAAKWRINNPEKRTEQQMRREAKKRGVTIGDTREIAKFYQFVRSTPSICCYWCKKSIRPKNRHVDHITPLARGGAHALANLCCSCADCNMRKNNKLPEEFSGQYELPL